MTAEEYLNEKILKGNRDSLFLVNTILNLMQDFARLKCEEQREICADEYLSRLINFDKRRDKGYTAILNSPEPEI
jgi:hypothetical protein